MNIFQPSETQLSKTPRENFSPVKFRKSFRRFVLTFAFTLFAFINSSAAPGDLDPTFGGGGITPYPGGGLFFTRASARLSDGKIIIGGLATIDNNPETKKFALVRYLANGIIDTSFGTNGVALSQMYGDFNLYDLAVLPNGKIIAVGSVATRIQNVPVYIYTQDSLVIEFSAQGQQENTYFSRVGQGFYSSATAIKVLPDGKYYVIGSSGGAFEQNFPYKLYVLKFSGGSLDQAFGNNGAFFNEIVTDAAAVDVQSDGKIIVAGLGSRNGSYGLALIRLQPNGNVDNSFGTDGIRIFPEITSPFGGTEMIIQPDDKILVTTTVNTFQNPDFGVFRFSPDGLPDQNFGTNGKVVTAFSDINDVPRSILLQPDGKILAVGATYNNQSLSNYRPAIARYNTNGSLDATFGVQGLVTAPAGYNITDALLQPDGKIVAVTENVRVMRFLGDASFAKRATDFDFDGDGWADFAVTRNVENNFNWFAGENPSGALIVEKEWGLTTDKIVPADYDGDRKTDIAVFRPADGSWYILKSSNNSISAVQFGQNGDVPVPEDFDGDGRADQSVFRGGKWFILNSSNNAFRAEQFGVATDKPIRADFDGDGRADLAVFRDGIWYAQRSTDGFFAAQFGLADDRLAPGDYDGDGKTDLAVFRPSNGVWYLQNSTEGFKAFQFGLASDKLAPADYDADGKKDIAVFRDGVWYIRGASGELRVVHFGNATDRPIPNSLLP